MTAESLAHVETVLQQCIDDGIPTAIEESVLSPEHAFADPQGNDYKHPRWDTVRELKDDNYMASLRGYEAVPVLERILGDLTLLGYESPNDAIDDLEALWDKVKLGANEAPLAAAARMADRFPLTFQTARLSKKYQLFLNIACHLQAMRGDDYISLPVVRLGEILSVDPHRVSDYRKFAQDDGFLHQVAKSCYSSNGGVATKFRFACQFVDGVAVAPDEVTNTIVKSEALDPYQS